MSGVAARTEPRAGGFASLPRGGTAGQPPFASVRTGAPAMREGRD